MEEARQISRRRPPPATTGPVRPSGRTHAPARTAGRFWSGSCGHAEVLIDEPRLVAFGGLPSPLARNNMPDPPRRISHIPRIPRNHMNMNVQNRLPSVAADVHTNVVPRRFQRAIDPLASGVDQMQHARDLIDRQIESTRNVPAGNDEACPRATPDKRQGSRTRRRSTRSLAQRASSRTGESQGWRRS